MLPVGARLRHRPEFTAAVRGGRRRAGRSALLVVHLLAPSDQLSSSDHAETQPARAGFVVARSVGNAVVRNRVRRRLRHLVAARLADLPPGANLVVRALPGSASASSAALAADLEQAIAGAVVPPRAEAAASRLRAANPVASSSVTSAVDLTDSGATAAPSGPR